MVRRGGGGELAAMKVLEGGNVGGVSGHGANAAGGGAGGRQRGDAGNVVAHGGAANGFFVVEGFAAERRVDDQIHLAGLDQVHDIRAALVHFVHRFKLDPRASECCAGASRGDDSQAGGSEVLGDGGDMALVVVVDAHEDNSRERQALACGELRLGKGEAECGGNAHYFASRAHLGTEDGIHAAEFIERERGRFHGVELADGEFLHATHVHNRKMQVFELAAGHQARGDLGQRDAGGFADVGNGAGGAWIHFKDEDLVVLDGVLHVHQADNVESAGEAHSVIADVREHLGLERDRRENAGGIAGVDAGFFNMLHDSADDDILTIGECVHVHFGCVFEKLVNQDRTLGIGSASDLGGLGDVFLDGFQIVGNDHGAPAENVAWPDENREADLRRGSDRFLRLERRASARLGNIQLGEKGAEAAAIFREVNGLGIGADDFAAVALQLKREIQRGLPAELDDYALWLFAFEDGEDVFKRERLEVEAVGGVVIGRDRFGVAIDHHGFVTVFLERKGGVAATIIEFNSLPDAAGAAAEDDDFRTVHRVGFVVFFVG